MRGNANLAASRHKLDGPLKLWVDHRPLFKTQLRVDVSHGT